MKPAFYHKISGADKFQLLLDRHIKSNNKEGNLISLYIEVKGKINIDDFKKSIAENKLLTQINSLEIEGGFLKIPRWKNGLNQVPVNINVVNHNEPVLPLTDIKVIGIQLQQHEENSAVMISIPHVITDNIGLQTMAKIIDGCIDHDGLLFAEEEKEKTTVVQQLIHTWKATVLVFKKTPKLMAKLVAQEVETGLYVSEFDEQETAHIEQCAIKAGAVLSRSAFYLACISTALRFTIFENKGSSFFVPVPQNQRLRGNKQITIGNHLSFLFYTIPFNKLGDTKETTAFITEQMIEQVKKQSPKSYSYLLKTFRLLPLWLYNLFFKMPTKGAVCSFLFSDVGETLADIKTFMGKEIIDVVNLPSNPCPPHLTFVLMKHAEKLKVIAKYNKKAISTNELAGFNATLKKILTR